MRLEIRPGEGGADSEKFAQEISESIAKKSGLTFQVDGNTRVFSSL